MDNDKDGSYRVETPIWTLTKTCVNMYLNGHYGSTVYLLLELPIQLLNKPFLTYLLLLINYYFVLLYLLRAWAELLEVELGCW